MKFLKKRAKHVSRRSAKLFAQRLRRLTVFVIAGCGLVALSCYCIKTHALGRATAFVHQTALASSAAAGFRVEEILVTGRKRISAAELLARLDIKSGTPIFGVSITEAQARVATIPWVKSISVSRRLPSKIAVHITERIPVALWQYKKKLALIDAEGTVLTSDGLEHYQDLPLFVGEDAGRHAVELMRLVQAEPEIAKRLVSAQRIGHRRWDIRLQNNVLIRLPEGNIGYALRRAAAQQEKTKILDKSVVTIDLRLPDKLVIKIKADAKEETSQQKKST